MKPLRMTVKLRNNRLTRLRGERRLSQKALGREAGINWVRYNALENLRLKPVDRYGNWTAIAEKLAIFYEVPPEYLFPEVVQDIVSNTASRELDGADVQGLLATMPQQALGPGDMILAKESIEEVEEAINEVVPEREKLILCWRFGLKGEREHTLEEVSTKFGLSRDRIRQLEARALSRVRRHLGENHTEEEQDDMARSVDRVTSAR